MPTFSKVACVGMYHRGQDAKQLAASLEPGTLLRLEREPENPHDAFAIKVLYEDTHIGYIERGQAAWISPHLDEGGKAEALVSHIEERNRNFHPILDIAVNDPEDAE